MTPPKVHHGAKSDQTGKRHCHEADQAQGCRVNVQVERVHHQVSVAGRAVFMDTVESLRTTTICTESGWKRDMGHRLYTS